MSNIYSGGTNLDSIFEPRSGVSKRANVNIYSGTTDISNLYAPANLGMTPSNVGIYSGSTDIANLFASKDTVNFAINPISSAVYTFINAYNRASNGTGALSKRYVFALNNSVPRYEANISGWINWGSPWNNSSNRIIPAGTPHLINQYEVRCRIRLDNVEHSSQRILTSTSGMVSSLQTLYVGQVSNWTSWHPWTSTLVFNYQTNINLNTPSATTYGMGYTLEVQIRRRFLTGGYTRSFTWYGRTHHVMQGSIDPGPIDPGWPPTQVIP